MSRDDWTVERELLAARGVSLAPGLSESELRAAESTCRFRFPPDLRSFLSSLLPTGRGFPNWRAPSSPEIRDWWEMVFDRIAFDIENNTFWWESWGPKPTNLSEAIALARTQVENAPRLIPIFMHRAIPAEPALAGNPVFSIYQTDVVCYGGDLSRYIAREFGTLDHASATGGKLRRIPFWGELADSDS